jgi:transforming growth factor-beta-induced protein
MEQKDNKPVIAAIIAVLVLIGGGLGIYALTQNDDEAEVETSQVEQAPVEEAEEEATPSQTVVDLAVATPQLSTLVAAVQAAGLAETLSGEGPFTVLAPTDDAFAAALEALNLTAEELLASEDLAGILTYHVIGANVLSSDLTNGQIVETLNGGTLTVEVSDAGVFFVDANGGRAQVTTADVVASNGVVHIIDAVLLP